MKRKEKEELKHDKFIETMEKVFSYIIKHRTKVLTAFLLLFLLAVVLLTAIYFKNRETIKFSMAIATINDIVNNSNLAINERITKLEAFPADKDIKSYKLLRLATLYYQQGQIPRAMEIVSGIPDSGRKIIDQQKQLLLADLLLSQEKRVEAKKVVQELLITKDLQLPVDFLLFKLAQIQYSLNEKDDAVLNLRKMLSEHPQSPLSSEADKLLKAIEKS